MGNSGQATGSFDDSINTTSVIGIAFGASMFVLGIVGCICVGALYRCRQSRRAQRYESVRNPIQPIVTTRLTYSENERHTAPTRAQQASSFLSPTSTQTIRSTYLPPPPYQLELPHPPYSTHPTQLQPTYNTTFNANSNATNNSVRATDTPPSYNASQSLNGQEMIEAQLPPYSVALMEHDTLQEQHTLNYN